MVNWKVSHKASITNGISYGIMAGIAPTVGVSSAGHRAIENKGGGILRQGRITGSPVIIPVLRGGLPIVGLRTMCEHNVLSVNPQCSGGVGRRPFVCRRGSRSAGKTTLKGLRECSLIGS